MLAFLLCLFVHSPLFCRPLQQPTEITFVVVDELSAQSEAAVASIHFSNIDNPPTLDLNGPTQPGRNYTTQYLEGSHSVSVCLHVYIHNYACILTAQA